MIKKDQDLVDSPREEFLCVCVRALRVDESVVRVQVEAGREHHPVAQ